MAITILQDQKGSGNSLLQAMSQMEGIKERKKQAAWERKYKAPYMEALTEYMNAQADLMADTGLRAAEESLKNRQAMLTKQQAKALKAENRSMKDLRKSDPEAFRSAMMNKLKGASDSQTMRQMGVMIDGLRLGIEKSRFDQQMMMDQIKKDTFLFQAIGAAENLGMNRLSDAYKQGAKDAAEKRGMTVAPEKPSISDRVKGLFTSPGEPTSPVDPTDVDFSVDPNVATGIVPQTTEELQKHLQDMINIPK